MKNEFKMLSVILNMANFCILHII